MSSVKSIAIFICVCYIALVGAEESCGQQYKLPNWEADWKNFPPPAGTRLGSPIECPTALEIQIKNQTEDLSLTLLANPLVTDGKCPPITAKNYFQLRKYHKPYFVKKGVNETKSLFFGKIFTGCYYVEMRNTEGKHWLWNPVFKMRNYHYYDTALKCNFQMKPREQNVSTELRYNITIPLTYSQLRCQLFEHQTNHTKDVLDSGKISAIQDCLITYNGNGMVPLVKCNWDATRPQITADVAVGDGDGWQTIIRVSHLRNHVTFYSVKWEQHIRNYNISSVEDTCEDLKQRNNDHISYGDLKTWQSVIKFGALVHDIVNVTTDPLTTMVRSGFWYNPMVMIGFYILLGVTITAVLAYWMTKYARVLHGKNRAANNLFVSLSDIAHDQEESNHILLIYAYDSPWVMGVMEALRCRLQQVSLFPVHDLYSDDEFNMIMALGATGWVESLLKDGCKVVWVDTPQFRSVLKDNKSNKEQKQHKAGDFRDEAIPYAVALAKDLFQDASTQYCRHFVVRLEGFEVEERSDDPLFVVSPHVRYNIPEHLTLLCDHLTR